MAVLTAGFMGVGAMGLAVPFAIGELSDPIVIGGTTTVIGGTTTVIGGTTTVIGGSTITTPGSTITTPGSTITTPGSTIVSTITIATPGNPALMFAKSTACNAIVLQGANSQFQGAVVSNGGVDAHSSGMGGDTLVWGTTVAPGCLTVNSSLWGSITSQAPIDWPAPLPVCTPGCTPTNAAAQAQITSVDGATCTPAPAVNWAINSALAPGLYCARGSISVRANLTNVGLVAPTIDVRGVVVSGTSFLPAYGGLAFYAYAAGGTVVSSSGIGFSFRGAIYAPFGQVDLIVSGSQAACPDPTAAGCGFIEADTVRLAGANAKWQGLGPGFGGSTTTTTTTTTPGSTTTTPGVITTYPSITTTIPGTTTVIGGTTTVIGGTTTVIGGVTVTIPSGPVVASFDPLVGGVGTVVTISGSYLAGTTDVFFGGTPAASFTVNDDSTVTATVPLGASSGPISVATAAGTAASFLPFTFVPAPTISSFSPAAGSIGTVVSIVGADLTGATSVAFNGTDVTSFLVNDAGTLLTASVPEGAITGVISVTTPGGSTSSATAFVVDGVAPTVLISSGPDDPSSSASASFVFAASDAGSGVASVECQVDDGAFAACLSPLGLSDLSEGAHTFTVRATDYAGNTDVTPASYAWVVDTLAPTTTIDINPPTPSNDSTPTFTFTGADTPGSGVASFECQIDSDGFSACTTPDTLAALTDGSHTFDVRAIDKAGNTDVTPASYTWVVDTVKPDVTVNQRSEFPAQGDPTNAQPILFTAVFSKEINASTFGTGDVTLSGCAGATASLSPVLLSLNTYEISVTGMIDPTNCTLTVSIPMDGVEDLAGNLNTDSTSSDNSVTYDTIAPETTIGTKPSDPSNDATPDFTFSGTDIGGSGVASYECKIDLGSFAVCSSSPKTLTTLTEGPHTFSVRAIDNAGNVDATPDSYTWVTDTIAPTVAYASQSPAANGAGWNKTDVVATFTATDLLSGFAGPSTTKTGTTTSSGEGVAVNVDSPAFMDLAGNSAAAGTASHSVKIDKTKPTISAAATTSPNGAGWYKTSVTVHFTCADALSGIPAATCPADETLSTEGAAVSSTAETVTDVAGNTSDASNVVTVSIDKTKPTISAAATISANFHGWYNGDVTVHFNCTDALSGIPLGGCPADQTLNDEGSAVASIAKTVTDVAGNTSDASNVVTVKIDKTAPGVVYASQSPAANGAGWNKTDVVATFTATDLLSGFAGPSTTKTGTTTSSGEGVAVNVDSPAFTDLAGNTAAAGTASHSVKIDKTPPVVTCPAAPQFVLNQPGQTLTATVSDVLSGAVSPTVSASAITSVSGSGLTVLLTGSDKAGNSTAVSCPYSVVNGFLGFATPLPKSILGTNSAIVVKFQLGNNAGVALTDEAASAVQTQATISANADGSSPLSLVNCAYSKTSHRYQCSLKAPKNVAKYPTPYYLTVYEMIGSTYVKAPAVASSTSSNPEIVYFK